jgi:hypothetical protein
MKPMKMNGFAWGAVATTVMFVYLSFINEIQVLGENSDGSFFIRYSCGSILNPTYPLDGKGPCTDLIQNQYWLPAFWGAATLILAVVAWRKADAERR